MDNSCARIAGILKHSSVNGPGVRYVVFFQGCPHDCPGCHNPETHDPSAGEEKPVLEILDEIKADKYIDGVTLSGGDPFLRPEATLFIAKGAKESGLSVWAYSGWTYEEIVGTTQKAAVKVPDGAKDALAYIDVLVDGRYVDELHVSEDEEHDYMWRGSKNQRLIDVKKSMEAGKAVLLED